MKKTKNQLITQWTPTQSEREKQRDLKFQIDSLIERARDALDKQTKIIDDSEEINIEVKNVTEGRNATGEHKPLVKNLKNSVINNEKIESVSNPEIQDAKSSDSSENNSENKINKISTETKSSELYESKKLNRIEEVIGTAATKLAKDIGASCLISVERASKESQESTEFILVKVSIYRRLNDKSFEKAEYLTKMRKVISGSIVPIKKLLF